MSSVVVVLSILLAVKSQDICSLDADVGPCEAAMPRWYFDGSQCTEFIYGGCQGNANNFETQEECLNACSSDICSLAAETGACRGAFPRYYFDGSQCSQFTYGGCGGNANNFESLEDCQNLCDPCSLPAVTGLCKAYFPRYYFDGNRCAQFIYGGCGGNANNFETKQECKDACK
mmetsp:Transcript_31142/g.50028  ORF Transcript_31142/g.50028 Transcript_31142/m.50028 type:complete len:174 (+) Transcript_31142:38-559(+)|eukprot:CAMPEP_0197022202 /NCGR_PEP_ID=MMETSP1384-20130603/3106_1 /TAXON_ID=29189 /ORGANISM="Ammonia sp." /LENGTH=173 /DNA_ID=CAMNT_0042450195 /DNA_START=32 /DNA_END=553 /DNA_ORIENTATION=+